MEAARVRDSNVMSAFLNSCDGRWLRTARLPRLQLTNEEVLVRMQRYLQQPLSALAGFVASRGLDAYGVRDGRAAHPGTVIDAFGDCFLSFLSAYKAKDDAEWIHLHNALCRALRTFALQASVSAKLEGGKAPKRRVFCRRRRLTRLDGGAQPRAVGGRHCGVSFLQHVHHCRRRGSRGGCRRRGGAQAIQVPQ